MKKSRKNPGQLLGAFEFLSRFERNPSPDMVVYKSYTDIHRKAYWTEIDIATPWQNKPGAIRARRDSQANTLEIELARVETATVDLKAAGMKLAPGETLSIRISRLDEPVFDPALSSTGEPLSPRLILRGDLSAIGKIQGKRDAADLPESELIVHQDRVEIRSFPVEASTLLVLRAM